MKDIVLIPGDGIGPEITEAVKKILATAGAEINWIETIAGLGAYEQKGNPLPEETITLIRKHKIALKGPLTTPVGTGFRSVNVALRKEFNLYANIRPAKTLPNVPSPCSGRDIDLVLFRENTQGLYIGEERFIGEEKQRAESIAVITREASQKIIKASFEYARKNERKKVTLVHKANILKYTSGMFLQIGRELAPRFPDIEFEDIIVDNMAMQMVMRPERFDVIVTTNLFGDILSDLASGLVGGLGVTGSGNIGDEYAMFEAVHGSAPDIAGQNMANPIAFLFASIMMLEYIGQNEVAQKVRFAVLEVLANHKDACTKDIHGKGTTTTFTNAICMVLEDRF